MQNKNYLVASLCCLLAAGGFMAYQGGAMKNGAVSFLTQSVDQGGISEETMKLDSLKGDENIVYDKSLREQFEDEKFDERANGGGEGSKKYTCSAGACVAKLGGEYLHANCNNMCGSTTTTTDGGGTSGGGTATSTSTNTTTSSSAGGTSVGSTTNAGSTNNGGNVGGADVYGTTTSNTTPLIKYLCNGNTKLLEKHVDQPGWPIDGSCSSNMDLRHVCSSIDPNLAGAVCNNGSNVNPNPTNDCSLHHYRCEISGLVSELSGGNNNFGMCNSNMQLGNLCSSTDPNLLGIICNNGNNDPNPTNDCSLHHYRCEVSGLVSELSGGNNNFGMCNSNMLIGSLCSSFDNNLSNMMCHQL